LIDHLSNLRQEALTSLDAVSTPIELENWRVKYLGRKGPLTEILRGLGQASPEERKEVGAAANQLKQDLESSREEKESTLQDRDLHDLADRDAIDVTLPGRPAPLGHLHPITQIIQEIVEAFSAMGFQTVEGPEVEWDRYNFEALNIPQDHPAREQHDTFWIDEKDKNGSPSMLLRTHTSPMQVRFMENHKPPIRVVVPGKVYRYEATDATHEWHFHQVEGLAIDEGISFSHLKGTLYEFAKRIFGIKRKIRFRCDYFPFVEPGAEMAIDDGKGGWLEIMGAGMVHPKVLEGVGVDPKRYTGFAFGMGAERIANLKYGIEDIRSYYSNDTRFLRQF